MNSQIRRIEMGDFCLPCDVMDLSLTYAIDSLTDLANLMFVSSNFYSYVNNSFFLRQVLIKFKGKEFSVCKELKDIKKFLVIDGVMSHAYQERRLKIKKIQDQNDNDLKYKKNKILTSIFRISLKSYKYGTLELTLKSDDNEISTNYFMISARQLKKLKQADANFENFRLLSESLQIFTRSVVESIVGGRLVTKDDLLLTQPTIFDEKNSCLKDLKKTCGVGNMYFSMPDIITIEIIQPEIFDRSDFCHSLYKLKILKTIE